MNLTEKWKDMMGEQGEEVPAIATASKQQVMSRILENQSADIATEPAYFDRELLRA